MKIIFAQRRLKITSKNNIRIEVEFWSQVQRQRNIQWTNVTALVTMTSKGTKCNENYIGAETI